MNIKKASADNLAEILAVYETARSFMAENGNPTQGSGGYPQEELLTDDIKSQKLYILEDEGVREGVFFFSEGPDSTYGYIDGKWQNELPYSVIHRVASRGQKRGILKLIVEFCLERSNNIKIDTHEDNTVMQKALEKLGFLKCGIIYLEKGEKRIAYQVTK